VFGHSLERAAARGEMFIQPALEASRPAQKYLLAIQVAPT